METRSIKSVSNRAELASADAPAKSAQRDPSARHAFRGAFLASAVAAPVVAAAIALGHPAAVSGPSTAELVGVCVPAVSGSAAGESGAYLGPGGEPSYQNKVEGSPNYISECPPDQAQIQSSNSPINTNSTPANPNVSSPNTPSGAYKAPASGKEGRNYTNIFLGHSREKFLDYAIIIGIAGVTAGAITAGTRIVVYLGKRAPRAVKDAYEFAVFKWYDREPKKQRDV